MARPILRWAALSAVIIVPLAAAAISPLLAWRHPVYIAGGFAGIVGLALLLVQPLLIGGYLSGLSPYGSRSAHRWIGSLLVIAVAAHVGALSITNPQDVLDALTFSSPTPFSDWGVVAMWAIFATGLLAAFRRRLRLRPRAWRIGHTMLAVVIVVGTVVHAILIEGAMEAVSKAALCALVLVATLKVIFDLRDWQIRRSRGE